MPNNSTSDLSSPSAVAEELVKIWTEVLQVHVGFNDNFLDLGGESLAAMSCIVRLRDAFGVTFMMEDFLSEEATVANFAARIVQHA
jgi:acyl carrier protein